MDTDDNFENSFTLVNTDGHFEVPWVWGFRWHLFNTHFHFQSPWSGFVMTLRARMCAFPLLLRKALYKAQQDLPCKASALVAVAGDRLRHTAVLYLRLRGNGERC